MTSKTQSFFRIDSSDKIIENKLRLVDEMTYLVISDLHIPKRQPEIPKVLLKILNRVDGVLALGDFVNLDTVLLLQQSTRNFFAVHGNMDHYDVKDYLPDKKLILLSGLNIGLCHGWGSPVGIRKKILDSFDNKPQVVLYGHTHIPDKTVENDVLFLNPGYAMYGGTYGLLKIKNGDLNFEVYKIEY